MWFSTRTILPPLQICLISPRPELVRRASRVVRGESDNGQSTRAGRALAALLAGLRRDQLIDEWTTTSRTHPIRAAGRIGPRSACRIVRHNVVDGPSPPRRLTAATVIRHHRYPHGLRYRIAPAPTT